MSSVQSNVPESLDQVLEAVRETPRGRWFLENYENRLRSDSTSKILDSIAKLEKHIASLSGTNADATLINRARAAISSAKRDIAAIDQKPAELSNEAQLFAKLAGLANNSNTQSPAISQGVERALRLVSELDLEFNAAAPAKPAETYFRQDDAVFEPAPAPQVVKPVAKSQPVVDATPRGAKLSIQRVSNMTLTPIEEKPIENVAAAIVEEQPAPQQSRIVIIRRKADEATEVPLLGQDVEHEESVSAA